MPSDSSKGGFGSSKLAPIPQLRPSRHGLTEVQGARRYVSLQQSFSQLDPYMNIREYQKTILIALHSLLSGLHSLILTSRGGC